jgi:hypothetical protein
VLAMGRMRLPSVGLGGIARCRSREPKRYRGLFINKARGATMVLLCLRGTVELMNAAVPGLDEKITRTRSVCFLSNTAFSP